MLSVAVMTALEKMDCCVIDRRMARDERRSPRVWMELVVTGLESERIQVMNGCSGPP